MRFQLEAIVTKEQLLKYAVNNWNKDRNCEISEDIIYWYIINELYGDGDEEVFDEDLILKKFNEYVAKYTLLSLCEKGLAEYDFDTNKYKITEVGKKEVKKGKK